MPYFTHIRKKPYFAVVEVGSKLYIDGQGYNPDTLKPIAGAELDVFAPTSTASFFDFGAPVIGLTRSSYICKTSQLSGINSGKVKVFDSSFVLTGQSIGTLGIGTDSTSSLFVAAKKDPSAADQKNDRLFSLSSSMEYLQNKSPISIQTGAENKAYRLNTVFWNQTTGSTRLMAINSETLVRGNTTSNNVATFTTSDLSTYQAVQSDLLEMNQLVYLDASKTNSTSSYAVVNRSQIASSSTKSPQTVMFDTSTGTRYVPPVEKVDSGSSSFWISIYGDLTGSTTAANQTARAIAVSSDGQVYGATSDHFYKIDGNGALVWQYKRDGTTAGGGVAASIDSSGQPVFGFGESVAGSQLSVGMASVSSSGSVLWSARINNLTNSTCGAGANVAVDLSGNLYFAGRVGSTGYIQKRDPSGTLLWKYPLGDTLGGVAVDSAGNVYAAGSSQYNSSPVYQKGHLNKMTPAGTSGFLATLDFGSGLMGWGPVVIDSSDNIYVAGTKGASAITLTGVLAKYTTSGTLVWAKELAYTSAAICLAVDSSGYLYVAHVGQSSGGCRLSKMDGSGNVIWCNLVRFPVSTTLADLKIGAFGNLYLSLSGTFVSGDKTVTCTMKLPPDGSGTGTYTFARGNLTYETSSEAMSVLNPTKSVTNTTYNPPSTDTTLSIPLSSGGSASTRQTLGTTYDPVPNSYVGCFASNAVWTTFNEGNGPVYFQGNCPYSGTLGLDFVRVRFITNTPTCKRVWATISNPSNLSLAIPTDMDYRNIRPFLFKNDSNQLMLGVFAYYNGTSSASNVSSLMVFSVGTTTQTDSITLTYLQRIDLSGGGTDFITSVTPVDDTQRSWLINYGDKAKIYTYSQASNFTLTNTYTWGRSGQVDSYGIDSRGRLWYTTGDVLSYIPLKTDPATVNTGLKAYFDESSYAYSGTTINSNLYVSAYALDGLREERSVTATLEGGAVQFADGTTTKTVTTSASYDLGIPIKVVGSGIFSAKLS